MKDFIRSVNSFPIKYHFLKKVKSAQDALLGLSGGFNFGSSQIGGFPMSYSSRRSSSSGGSGSPNSPPSPPHPMLGAPTGLRVLPSSRFYSLQYNNGSNGSQNMSRMGYTSPQVTGCIYCKNPEIHKQLFLDFSGVPQQPHVWQPSAKTPLVLAHKWKDNHPETSGHPKIEKLPAQNHWPKWLQSSVKQIISLYLIFFVNFILFVNSYVCKENPHKKLKLVLDFEIYLISTVNFSLEFGSFCLL